jgi:hypothetical protein
VADHSASAEVQPATINLFMRESGTSVDAIKLTTDKAYRPDQAASIPTISLAPNTPSSGG